MHLEKQQCRPCEGRRSDDFAEENARQGDGVPVAGEKII